MTNTEDMKWFTLACQPQEPLSPGGATLSGDALRRWKSRFWPFLRYLSRRDTVLALSGGGMAMPAHISTLRVLELLDVAPRAIYGTSAGAVIGGLHAAGMSSAEIEEAMLAIRSANDLFGFAARYPALRLAAFAIKRRFQKPTLEELGIYDLDRIESHVAEILMQYVGDVPRMDQLRVPFHCIAVDIGAGEPSGDGKLRVCKEVFSADRTPEVRLSDAIGASMSIPGVITPKKISGTFYIDGAAAEHLPILTACDDWKRRRRRFRRSRLAIVASDLGYTGEPIPKGDLADPIDLVIFSRRLQERIVNHYNLLMCHRPKKGSSVILVRPRSPRVELYEIEKMRPCLHAAYEAAVTQLAGEGFLDETEAALETARSFLRLSAGFL